jgi:vacuolar-type H+-ATPase subunit I/STV1
MSDRPEDSPEERRRTGPLGDNAETRSEPPPESDAGETRPIPARDSQRTEEESARETERSARRPAAEKETRVIRTPRSGTASQEATPYPRGYFEAAEEREDRLRDMYGGVDWLASFLGFVFAVLLGAVFSLVGGLVLGSLGFSLDLGGGALGPAIITGLALVAVLIFLAYFFGGYVAGRLARFDGGRNGAMLLLWTFLAVLLIVLAAGVFSGLLPPGLSASLRDFIQGGVINTLDNLSRVGVVGVVIVVGAILVALLGGVLGGRMGSRYHAEIDRTT